MGTYKQLHDSSPTLQYLTSTLHHSYSCGAYTLKYMLTWDGDKITEDFTQVCQTLNYICNHALPMHYLCFTPILTYASLSNSGRNTCFQLENTFKPAAFGLQQASETIIQESYNGKFYTTSISCHVVPTFHDCT